MPTDRRVSIGPAVLIRPNNMGKEDPIELDTRHICHFLQIIDEMIADLEACGQPVSDDLKTQAAKYRDELSRRIIAVVEDETPPQYFALSAPRDRSTRPWNMRSVRRCS
jgi:hypothetical protein